MPRGSPLPPPLPPPPRPSRLSWPGPRRPPRTIMPFTAVGGRRWAAAAGARQRRGRPEGQGTREALRGAGRGCGVRPLGGLAGSMNRARQTHGARSSAPGCQESPCRWAAVAFLGMARPAAGAGGGAGSCPSFLPFFEIKILSSGRSAGGGPGGPRCQPARARRRTWASGSATPPGGTGPRRRPPGAHLPRALSAAAPAAGPRVWSGLARPRGVGVGREAARIARSGRPLALGPARHARACRRRGGPFPPRRLRARGPAPRRHALPPRAPRGPPPAVGASPSPSPPRLGPAAAQQLQAPGPCAWAAPRAARPPGRLRRSPRRGHPPGPRLLPCLSTSNFRASRENRKEGRRPRAVGTRRRLPAGLSSPGPQARSPPRPQPPEVFCVASPPFV